MKHAALTSDEAIAQAILSLLSNRKPDASICPSEAARSLAESGPDWRAMMPRVRAQAATLAMAGHIAITQGGKAIDPQTLFDGSVRGPVRLKSAGKDPAGPVKP
jgi:Protein of unknown function (DUF3253)